MKKSSFFHAPIGVLTVLLLLVAGCKSAPPPAEPTIWDLLLARNESARGFFLGEVDVNATDDDGRTPLHYAAELNDAQLTSFLISIGANVNARDHSMQSPLGIAIGYVDTAVAKLLVDAGADIHLRIKDTITTAAFALDRGPTIFRSILTSSNIETVDSNNMTVLHLAAFAGNTEAVQNILAISTSSTLINKNDKANRNALDYALARPDSLEHMQIAERLVLLGSYSNSTVFDYFGPAARSANYNIRRREGLAPIHYAVMNSYIGLITFLLEKNIDINIKSLSGATALHEAVRIGNIQIIKMLLDANADVNARDANNNTPLHTGTPPAGHKEIITLLLEKEADPNLRDDHGDTPLHVTITLNRPLDVIQTLLDGNSDVHIRNIQGKTPLYIAVQENRSSLIPALLTAGSEVFASDNSGVTPFDIASRDNNNIINLLITPETINQRDSEGNTMLHAAVRNRVNPTIIGRILDTRPLIDARNRAGDTALHIAVRMNQRDSGEFLISRGSNIFSLNSTGQSPLFLALSGNDGIREWIINPATINARDGLGNNMLHYAAEWNFINAIPIIIRGGLSVEAVNVTGETPLFMAAKTNSPSTIRVLADNNANLNVRDSKGNSILHTAVRWNARSSIEMLISTRMDLNPQAINGNTPLHDAIIFQASEIETMLIRNGANLELRNVDGNTHLMEAVRGGHLASVEKLVQNRADINTRNTRGDTPLHVAVSSDKLEIITILLRGGASIHARNTVNRTPFQLSLAKSSEMVSFLLTADRINTSDDLGNSALHIALQERAASSIISTIISKGVMINTVDNNGRTPLRLAVDMELWDSAKVIADAGANPFIAAADIKTPAEISFTKGEVCIRAIFSGRAVNSRDSSGNTILHLAAHQGNPGIISLLIDLGANKTIRNISADLPYDIAIRWNRADNADILR